MKVLNLNGKKLELEYPCKWCYKIVINKNDNAKKISKEVLADKNHNISESKTSKKGKFKSYNIDLTVKDEKERLNLYNKFKNHKDVIMVI